MLRLCILSALAAARIAEDDVSVSVHGTRDLAEACPGHGVANVSVGGADATIPRPTS